MKSFTTTISIKAPAARIWSVLTDAAGYPAWNSTVDRITGTIALGEKVTVYAKASPGRAFALTVTALEPNKKMIWSGGMPLGLFTGTRTFTLEPRATDVVEFEMREQFSGMLAPLITRSIPDLQPAFDQFAADLKQRAETPT